MPVAVGMVELVTDAAVVVDPVRTAGTVDALVVDVGEVSVDEVSGSEVVLAVDVALLASDKGAVLVELVAVVESTSTLAYSAVVPYRLRWLIQTQQGPTRPWQYLSLMLYFRLCR